MYNKLKYFKLLLFGFIVFFIHSVIFAQTIKYSDRLNILIMGGTNRTYSDYVISDLGFNLTLGAEYMLPAKTKSKYGFVFTTGYKNANGIDNNLGLPTSFSTSIIPFSFAAEYDHYYKREVLPFVSLGFSFYVLSFSDENIYSKLIDKTNGESKNSFVWDLNTGIKYNLNPKLTLKFQIGLHFLLNDNLDAITIGNHNDFIADLNVGVSYNLWGEIDSDGDGIFDDKDKCPNLEEDYDGFQDEDGCPDLDNDGDGINDDVDLCVNKAEDFDGFEDEDGCPEFDNDRDNIQDSEDKCPNQAEDFDGFEDEDGCPDLDNDGDGILDRVDKCPNQPENINGFEDEDGCPDILPADESEDNLNKKLDANKKYILHGETTFEKNSFILKESKSTELNDIANVMNDNPEVLWRIEGHVEKNDSHSKSTKISIKYADTIKRYLISKGVSSGKLRVIGLGDSSPIATNNTVFGRMKNRRVIIIKLN